MAIYTQKKSKKEENEFSYCNYDVFNATSVTKQYFIKIRIH